MTYYRIDLTFHALNTIYRIVRSLNLMKIYGLDVTGSGINSLMDARSRLYKPTLTLHYNPRIDIHYL